MFKSIASCMKACQHVNKTTKFREQYQERARANSKSPEKNSLTNEIPSRKRTVTAAALRDEKKAKAEGVKEGRSKRRYNTPLFAKDKITLSITILVLQITLISQMTPSPVKFCQKSFGLQICICAWKTKSA